MQFNPEDNIHIVNMLKRVTAKTRFKRLPAERRLVTGNQPLLVGHATKKCCILLKHDFAEVAS
jgi:hypothetical protein